MKRRLRILDLFCGSGGAAYGYYAGFARAGYDICITGIDITEQPDYPFSFHCTDAMSCSLDDFDFVHASPPCQEYSSSRHIRDATCPDAQRRATLVDVVYEKLRAAGIPWVIENVEGAPMPDGVMLCGAMFGLPIRRHRLFASSEMLLAPPHPRHKRNEPIVNVVGGRVRGYGRLATEHLYQCGDGSLRRRESYYPKSVGQAALGINWMTVEGMSQAVPPVYTEWLAWQLAKIF